MGFSLGGVQRNCRDPSCHLVVKKKVLRLSKSNTNGTHFYRIHIITRYKMEQGRFFTYIVDFTVLNLGWEPWLDELYWPGVTNPRDCPLCIDKLNLFAGEKQTGKLNWFREWENSTYVLSVEGCVGMLHVCSVFNVYCILMA